MTATTDLFAVMEAAKATLAAGYAKRWHRSMLEWTRQEVSDRAWLLYSANYLFRTGGTRWALDPVTLHHRLPSAPRVDLDPLVMLDYVVLSHRHADHLDINLLTRLCDFPAQWIVPEFLLDNIRTIDRPRRPVIVAKPMQTLELGGLRLTPFEGNHWETAIGHPDERRGVPAMGYLAEFNNKRWLIPGDTRTYDGSKLPAVSDVTGLIAHLWLGRSQAMQAKPALVEEFCRYCLATQPGRIIITHLQEVGRRLEEYLDMLHYDMVRERLQELAPDQPVQVALMGDSFDL